MTNLIVIVVMLTGVAMTDQCMATDLSSGDAECENCTDRYRMPYTLLNSALTAVDLPHTALPLEDSSNFEKTHGPGLDQAILKIISKCSHNVTVSTRSSECYECSYRSLVHLEPYSETTVILDTKHGTDFKVWIPTLPFANNVCNDSSLFMQYGNYAYHISPNGTSGRYAVGYLCVLSSDDPPMDVNIPVWVFLGLLVVLFSLWTVGLILNRRYSMYARACFGTHRIVNDDLGIPQSRSASTTVLNQSSENETGVAVEGEGEGGGGSPARKTRLKSLDTFRGISIVVMIFVNYGGGEYWYFKHSAWNGLTVADLVFPWFIFIMGTSMAFSFHAQLRRSIPWSSILVKIVKRSAVLILLGIFLNSRPGCPDKETRLESLRIPGVLQRIGVTYLVTALVHLCFVYKQQRARIYHVFEWIVHLLLLALYLSLTFFLPVPGCPTGYLGPGGLASFSMYENCTGGAAGYIDRVVFGPSHMYKHPTSQRIYGGSTPYDPEGLLGCLTSIFLCFLGLQAGRVFDGSTRPVRYKLLACSVVATGLGILLCLGSKETGWIPINKNLWSLSYVLCMAGTGYFLLALCYSLIDGYNVWTGAPFVYVGMNPVLLYLCHEIFANYLPVSFHVHMDHWSQLAMDVWGTAFWVIVGFILHINKIYFSI